MIYKFRYFISVPTFLPWFQRSSLRQKKLSKFAVLCMYVITLKYSSKAWKHRSKEWPSYTKGIRRSQGYTSRMNACSDLKILFTSFIFRLVTHECFHFHKWHANKYFWRREGKRRKRKWLGKEIRAFHANYKLHEKWRRKGKWQQDDRALIVKSINCEKDNFPSKSTLRGREKQS